jgi:PTS system nitrogen regulatory IIA component
LVEVLAEAEQLERGAVESVVKSIIARERTRGTTGFGKGVAAPHAKIDGLPQVVAAVGRSTSGVDFASLDGELVHGVFLILSPAGEAEQHLRAMDLVFRHLQQERFRKFLRQSDGAEKIYDLLKEVDEKSIAT